MFEPFKYLLIKAFATLGLTFCTIQLCLNQEVRELTLDKAILLAMENNPIIKNSILKVSIAETAKKEIWQPGLTQISFHYGQDYSVLWDQGVEVKQNFGSILAPFYRSKTVNSYIKMETVKTNLEVAGVLKDLKIAYNTWLYYIECLRTIDSQLMYYEEYYRVVKMKCENGETDQFTNIKAELGLLNFKNQYYKNISEKEIAENNLRNYLFTSDSLIPPANAFYIYEIDKKDALFSFDSITNSTTEINTINLENCKNNLALQKSLFSPELFACWNNHQINNDQGFNEFEIGLAIPLWPQQRTGAIQKAKYNIQVASNEITYYQAQQQKEVDNLIASLNSYFQQIRYYEKEVLPKIQQLNDLAEVKLKEEEFDFQDYFQSIRETLDVELEYLNTIKNYNETAIKLEYLTR
jgi:cobalt-zinc-cadmium resistance protein CzcA